MNSNGVVGANKDYNYSGFIKVVPGETLYFMNCGVVDTVRYVTVFDANKNVIKGLGTENVESFTVPDGAEYVIITSNALKTQYLEVVNEITPKGFISKEICIPYGKSLTIYKNQLVSDKSADLTFVWECGVGTVVDENYFIEGKEIGEYPLKVTAKDAEGNVVWSGNSTIKIVKDDVKEMKILPIGDSLTNNKPWLGQINQLSDGKITFIGTRGKGNLMHEGRSGFTSAHYLIGKEYTFEKEGVHPFWDGTRFNYNYYKDNNDINPDAIQIFLGINGIQTNPTANVSNIVKMIDYIRYDDENIPIFVVNTMYKGPLEKEEEHLKVFNLTKELSETLSKYNNVYLVPVALTHDSDNNYKESDQIHPMDSGFDQVATCIYGSICEHIK